MNPEIVLGPPGTGKTTTLLGMVEDELAAGTAPDRIGYFSFTRRAAHEAQERACARFGLTERQLPYFRTLHSLAFWALGMSSADVLQGRRLEEFGDWIGVKVSGRMSMEEGSTFGFEVGDRCLHMENLARVRCIPLRKQYDEDDDGLYWAQVDNVSRGLAEFKKAHHLKDYTDMLHMFVESDWRAGLEVLFVDEAQDLSALQWRMVAQLARGCRRVVVAGDDDQAIYRWAGADVDHFVGMPGRVRVLEQSWRCPAAVQALSASVVSEVRNRRPKTWHARPEPGVLSRAQDFSHIDLSGRDILVLSRNACFLRDVEADLKRDGVIYEFRGKMSVRAEVLNGVRLWERLRRGEPVLAAEARRVYELMRSGTGVSRGHKQLPGLADEEDVTLESLRASGGLLRDDIWHEALDLVPLEERMYLLRALQRGESLSAKPRIRLSTIHGAKGGEADHVVLLRDQAWRTSKQAEVLPDDEARTWYVGVTRAREQLTVVAPQTRRSFDL